MFFGIKDDQNSLYGTEVKIYFISFSEFYNKLVVNFVVLEIS